MYNQKRISKKIIISLTIVVVAATAITAFALNTTLAFRTPPGSVGVPLGGRRDLGTVDVSRFRQIRVIVDERVGSPTNARIRLSHIEGSTIVGQLDAITLSPHSEIVRVYDVPGTMLKISAEGLGSGSGQDFVDVSIYGSE